MSTKQPADSDVKPYPFPQFGRLPRELKLMIWEEALPGPRIIQMKPAFLKRRHCGHVSSAIPVDTTANEDFFDNDESFVGLVDEAIGRRGPIPCRGWKPVITPAIPHFSICQEASRVALRFYTNAFGVLGIMPETWINFKSDSILLDSWHLRTDMERLGLDVRNVQNIIVSHDYDLRGQIRHNWNSTIAGNLLTGVKSLTVIPGLDKDKDFTNFALLTLEDISEVPAYRSRYPLHPMADRLINKFATKIIYISQRVRREMTDPENTNEFSFGALTTIEEKNHYLERRKSYNASRVSRSVVCIILYSPGLHAFEIWVSVTDTFGDVERIFREKIGISNEDEIDIFSDSILDPCEKMCKRMKLFMWEPLSNQTFFVGTMGWKPYEEKQRTTRELCELQYIGYYTNNGSCYCSNCWKKLVPGPELEFHTNLLEDAIAGFEAHIEKYNLDPCDLRIDRQNMNQVYEFMKDRKA